MAAKMLVSTTDFLMVRNSMAPPYKPTQDTELKWVSLKTDFFLFLFFASNHFDKENWGFTHKTRPSSPAGPHVILTHQTTHTEIMVWRLAINCRNFGMDGMMPKKKKNGRLS